MNGSTFFVVIVDGGLGGDGINEKGSQSKVI